MGNGTNMERDQNPNKSKRSLLGLINTVKINQSVGWSGRWISRSQLSRELNDETSSGEEATVAWTTVPAVGMKGSRRQIL